MTVYYVAKTGNDSNAGTSLSAPKLTIANACGVADGGTGNIVEIIDSEQYNEGDVFIYPNAITVRATGSNSPIMDGDSGNNDYAFDPYVSGCVFQGLHMRNYDNALVGGNTAGQSFLLSGCVGQYILGPQQIGGASTGVAEVQDCKIVCEQNFAFSCANANIWFNNSVIASNAVSHVVDSQQSHVNVTASFCTFIGSGYNNSNGRNGNIINHVYKIRNCIVSGSGDGINAYDSTYNLVHVSGDPFVEWSGDDYDGTPRSANTGEITGDPKFVSGSQPGKADPAAYGNVEFGTQDYSLTTGTPASGKGVSYGGVTLDIVEATRANPPTIGAYEFAQIWTDYETEDRFPFDPADLTINHYVNIRENQKYRIASDPHQTPFSRGIKGPSTLRGRNTPYKNNR